MFFLCAVNGSAQVLAYTDLPIGFLVNHTRMRGHIPGGYKLRSAFLRTDSTDCMSTTASSLTITVNWPNGVS